MPLGMFVAPILVHMYDRREVGNQTYGEVFGMSSENIQKDLMLAEVGKGFCISFSGAGILLIVCGLLLPKAMGLMAVGIGALSLIVGVMCGVNYFKSCAKIRAGEYRVCSATVVGRERESDDDGMHDHYLYCSDGERRWRSKVDWSEYKAVRDGQTVRCVFFKADTAPQVTYWNVSEQE